MEIINHIIGVIVSISNNILYVLSLYFMFLSLFGIVRRKRENSSKEMKKFALVVAAHNEEGVVRGVVESLKSLNYPKELYDIFVIADNCTDKTAEIAERAGANVYKRFNKDKRGKGYALEWMFDKIYKMDKKYDAIAIFDADNLASKDFLIEMNKELVRGYKVVQGYLDSKNPYDSWITASYSLGFWCSNRMFQVSRNNLGLSNQLGGTGFCISVDVLKKIGWGATCLTEDLEFTCKLVLNGYKVGWAHKAIVYDEKPLTLAQSWHQRKRWMQGFSDVSSRYFSKLMKKAIKDLDIVAFDCAIYSIQPILFILIGVSMIVSISNYAFMAPKIAATIIEAIKDPNLNSWIAGLSVISILLTLYTPFILLLDKKLNIKSLISLIVLPIFTITWLPISIQGMLSKNNSEWSHTKHTRDISIEDIENVN